MQRSQLVSNPFSLLMNPQAVLEALEKSERLGQLASRICRPLDKVTTPVEPGTDVADATDADNLLAAYAPNPTSRPF
ncbi:MAG: hypothetical protein ABIX46_02360 [Burkholderiaceae bacterium]